MPLRVNPLATAKGKRLACELCGKPARLQCEKCLSTYYCGAAHYDVDLKGIHHKLCRWLGELRAPPTVLGSEEDRAQMAAEKREKELALLELTRTEAAKLLHEGHFELAIPAALQALRFSMDLYGTGSIELVPAYLLLGDASIGSLVGRNFFLADATFANLNAGMQRYSQAEEYLSLAKWSVLKAPYCSAAVRSQLFRNFGKLYASQGRYDHALRHLANDVYYSAREVGPENLATSSGYFLMAQVFYQRGRQEAALAMYAKVVDIWRAFLLKLVNPGDGAAEEETLDEAQEAESMQMLMRICAVREETLGPGHSATGEVRAVLGLLQGAMGQLNLALESLEQGLSVLRTALGEEHVAVSELTAAMEVLEQQQ